MRKSFLSKEKGKGILVKFRNLEIEDNRNEYRFCWGIGESRGGYFKGEWFVIIMIVNVYKVFVMC